MVAKNVGELIQILLKFPQDTKIARRTNGHYSVFKETSLYVSDVDASLTEVKNGEIVEVPDSKMLRLEIYS